jgi:hypothetical protein
VSKTTQDLGGSLQQAAAELSTLSGELEHAISWFKVR